MSEKCDPMVLARALDRVEAERDALQERVAELEGLLHGFEQEHGAIKNALWEAWKDMDSTTAAEAIQRLINEVASLREQVAELERIEEHFKAEREATARIIQDRASLRERGDRLAEAARMVLPFLSDSQAVVIREALAALDHSTTTDRGRNDC